MNYKSQLKKAIQRQKTFDPKSGQCPICKARFRSDKCPHNIVEARQRLNYNIMKLKLQIDLTK